MEDSYDVEQQRSVLQEINGIRLNIDDVKRKVEESDQNVENDLNASKAYFSKLKFNFVELETKQGFIQSLSKADVNTQFQCEELKETEAKRQTKLLKSENNDLRKQVDDEVTGLVTKYESFQKRIGDNNVLVEEIGVLQEQFKTLEEIKQEQDKQLPKIDESVTVEDLRTQQQSWVQRKGDAEVKKAEYQAYMAKLKSELRALEAEEQATSDQINKIRNNRKAKDLEVMENQQWVTEMTEFVQKCSLISVQDWAEDHINIAIQTQDGPFEMHILCDPETGALEGAKVQDSTERIETIVKHAVSINDYTYLIRQMKNHVLRQE